MDDQRWCGNDFVVGAKTTKGTNNTSNKKYFAGPSTSMISKTEFSRNCVNTRKPKAKQSQPSRESMCEEPSQSKTDVAARNRKPVQSKTKSKIIGQTIPFHRLKTISEQEPLEIYLDLVNQFDQFFKTLTANIKTPDRDFPVLIEILYKLCQLPVHETRKYILTESWLKTEFWTYLLNYVERVTEHEKLQASKKVVSETQLNDLMWALLNYARFFIWNMPYGKDFVEFMEILYAEYTANCDTRRSTTVGVALEQLILRARNRLGRQFFDEIYPTLAELKAGTNYCTDLKPNVVHGRYPNVRHYIDIHLALLKEDFISPLRDGITEFMANPEQTRFSNIRVHEDIRIITRKSLNQKYEVVLVDLNGFRDNRKKNLRHSRFEFWIDSLLCFTSSRKMDDLILGVVSNRNEALLAKGLFQIDILKMYNVTRDIFKQSFLMIESEIHFEPYHQVYNVLKNMDHGIFPLRRYIIDCKTEPELPDYISSSNVKDFAVWPSAEQLNLNESQFVAFQGALTRKFCSIQGPPGTGKTYMGLKIISALLRNTQLQILIICRTNYTLDQYVMGTLKLTKEIVRMGFKSLNPELEKFNIQMLYEDTDSIDQRLKTAFFNAKMEYTNAVIQFGQLQNELGKCDIIYYPPVRKQQIIENILRVQESMRSISNRLYDLKQITHYSLVKSKRVIAMTTAYAARARSLVKMLRAPIVLIEETGDVLESHVVATLTENTQHLIMIGDHHQLRPATRVYQLAAEHKMDISLFERMINNGISCLKLTIQHRQRPEFVNLIRPGIYSELYDHKSVLNYPNVRGVAKNLFFVNHTNPETGNYDEQTVRNPFEARYLIHLCDYLIQQQGYQPSEITILTPYPGQLNRLFQTRKTFDSLAKVHFALVDNFQARDNKIILLSLVRSNKDGDIGLLAMKNRICVALSRAREGFYMIGNMKLLSRANKMWRTIYEELMRQNAIDRCLPLKIEATGKIVGVSNPQEFLKFTNKMV